MRWITRVLFMMALGLGLAGFAYQPASPQRVLEFPRDHGAHREAGYEWWYFTGHLLSPGTDQEVAGFELTVFRISPVGGPLTASPASQRPEKASYLMAHFAVSDLRSGRFLHRQFGLRERTSVARTSEAKLDIEMPGVRISMEPDGRTIRLSVRTVMEGGIAVSLEGKVSSRTSVTLHGKKGFSRKGACETCASHYSGFTRMKGSLTLKLGSKSERLDGQVWFDHEFGSNSLAGGQVGWDWFALQLKDGTDLMLFQLRDDQGKTVFKNGTLVEPDGKTQEISPEQIELKPVGRWRSPRTSAVYPASWEVTVRGMPSGEFRAQVLPKLADQELSGPEPDWPTYWEGTCEVRIIAGKDGGKTSGASNLAYLEMTGYDPNRRPRF